MTESPDNPVSRLRAALADRDARTVAALLASVPVAILVADGQPQVGRDDDGRVLPVFLSSDSVDAFGPGVEGAEVRLLRPQELHGVLKALAPDRVLFDPALTSAIAVPTDEVRSMLRGEYLDADGLRQLTGAVVFEPDPVGRDAVRAAVAPEHLQAVGRHAWMTTRTSRGTGVPTLALAVDVPPAEIERLLEALRSADLPGALEVTQLDEERTGEARSGWGSARLSAE